ncbi:hypothetical protein B0H10DRAFT_1213632 [Mycena sp. CBHHK59/15]|nr:hypothetical protein B0H10DRAFT_1213632 [Mycena sp. CBHHK59/15]
MRAARMERAVCVRGRTGARSMRTYTTPLALWHWRTRSVSRLATPRHCSGATGSGGRAATAARGSVWRATGMSECAQMERPTDKRAGAAEAGTGVALLCARMQGAGRTRSEGTSPREHLRVGLRDAPPACEQRRRSVSGTAGRPRICSSISPQPRPLAPSPNAAPYPKPRSRMAQRAARKTFQPGSTPCDDHYPAAADLEQQRQCGLRSQGAPSRARAGPLRGGYQVG